MDLLVRATFEAGNGLPDSRVVNSFAIDAGVGDQSESEIDAILTEIGKFYTLLPTGGTLKLSDYMSPEVWRGTGIVLKAYAIGSNLAGLSLAQGGIPSGAPVAEITHTLAAATAAAGLPGEVACALTLEALGRAGAAVEVPDSSDPGLKPDRPKQRRTGRLYLGPLNITTAATLSGAVRPTVAFRTDLQLAAVQLQARLEALDPTYSWSVWSKADAALRPITHVSIDDAFDTQRRRGAAPTARVRSTV